MSEPKWESPDPDAWKGDSKPWEEPDAWKLETTPDHEIKIPIRDNSVSKSVEVTIGVKPTVPIALFTHLNPETLRVKNRDALKLVSSITDGQKALTEENELFKYAADRNMWIRIPWEKL